MTAKTKAKELSPLRLLRDALEKTQVEFARLVGLAHPTIQSLETGRLRLSPQVRQRIYRETGAVFVKNDESYIVPYAPENITEAGRKVERALVRQRARKPRFLLQAEGGGPYTSADFTAWRAQRKANATALAVRAQHDGEQAKGRLAALLAAAAQQGCFENVFDDVWSALESVRERFGLEARALRHLREQTGNPGATWQPAPAPPMPLEPSASTSPKRRATARKRPPA